MKDAPSKGEKIIMYILAFAMLFTFVMINLLVATVIFVNLLIGFGLFFYYRAIWIYG